ncbi:type II secretion system protein N [uncultured Sulfitobacter sp.]|uniref:type II secretion system protein N n=1 Tax=uncultured Sulfitobacter sp. TaxID=191468 RepID=UPI002628CFA5|nr:type II secretion system protein N [uncultured Sulfitobacter sp.]
MATQYDGTPTPPIVESNATQKVRLGRIVLLGTFGAASAPSALVRLPRGNTQTVTLGDEIAGGTVEAIDSDRIVLLRMGNTQILTMPQG